MDDYQANSDKILVSIMIFAILGFRIIAIEDEITYRISVPETYKLPSKVIKLLDYYLHKYQITATNVSLLDLLKDHRTYCNIIANMYGANINLRRIMQGLPVVPKFTMYACSREGEIWTMEDVVADTEFYGEVVENFKNGYTSNWCLEDEELLYDEDSQEQLGLDYDDSDCDYKGKYLYGYDPNKNKKKREGDDNE